MTACRTMQNSSTQAGWAAENNAVALYSYHFDITNAGLSLMELRARMLEAQDFHACFLASARCDAQGLHLTQAPEWVDKLIRRSADIPSAVLAKLGSNTIAKRRPDEVQPFLGYIARCFEAQATLHLRIVAGPVKNVKRYGAYQSADMAEYLMLIQLGRVVETMAAIYPYGVRVQMVPDDKRGNIANTWPQSYSRLYIANLQRMVKELQFDAWLDVEDGQARLYEHYRVADYIEKATREVMNDEALAEKCARAGYHARENLFSHVQKDLCEQAVHDSAMRYMIAHKAEMLSGMWSPLDALPLVYANHPQNYQLYTMGRGLTKLPWQIRLPFAVLDAHEGNLVPLPSMRTAIAS